MFQTPLNLSFQKVTIASISCGDVPCFKADGSPSWHFPAANRIERGYLSHHLYLFWGNYSKKQFRIFKKKKGQMCGISALCNLSMSAEMLWLFWSVLKAPFKTCDHLYLTSGLNSLKSLYPMENDEKLFIKTSARCDCFIKVFFLMIHIWSLWHPSFN